MINGLCCVFDEQNDCLCQMFDRLGEGKLADSKARQHARQISVQKIILDFSRTYNATWLIQRDGFKPPSAIRA